MNIEDYPAIFNAPQTAVLLAQDRCVKQENKDLFFFVIFNQSTGKYMVDVSYEVHSDERLLRTFYRGREIR